MTEDYEETMDQYVIEINPKHDLYWLMFPEREEAQRIIVEQVHPVVSVALRWQGFQQQLELLCKHLNDDE